MKIGEKIHRVESCSSTNDLAHKMAQAGAEEGTVVIADEQTAGRGTKDRLWYSKKGIGLYLSVILRPRKRDMSLLPMVAGLAMRDALFEQEGLSVELKWPNDLVYDGKKLGGILCEASFLGNEISYAILGMGLNVNHEKRDFPENLRSHATSLKILRQKDIVVKALLYRFWEILDDWYGFFQEGKEIQIIRAFESHSIFSRGETLAVKTQENWITGEYQGIDLRGRLLLYTEGIERSFLAPEVLGITKEFKED